MRGGLDRGAPLYYHRQHMSETNNNSSGVGLFGIVFVVFLILKLAEIGPVAAWSWWWVTAPLWGGAALVCGVLLCMGLFAGFITYFARRSRLKQMYNEDQA